MDDIESEGHARGIVKGETAARALRRRIGRSPLGPFLGRLKHGWDRAMLRFADGQTRRHALVGAAGHPGIWRAKREFQFGFLKRMGLAPTDRVLEIGCGTLRGGLPVIEYLEDGHYWGIDSRESVLREASIELAEAGLEHKRPGLLLASDLGEVRLGTTFRIVWSFAVLQHMTDEILAGALACARAHLEPDGLFLASVNLADERTEGSWREFPDIARPLIDYLNASRAVGLDAQDLGPLSDLGHPADLVNAHHHMLLMRPGDSL